MKFPDNLWFAGDTPLEAGPSPSPPSSACAGLLKEKGLDSEDGVGGTTEALDGCGVPGT